MNPRRPFLLAALAVVLTLMTTLPGLTAGASEECPDYTVDYCCARLETDASRARARPLGNPSPS
ncbi:MAG TPA: hypothetical protein VM889_11645 [Candidatus Thermoplasmatota archaeon]|nr:hypothetical protein [Candidatus Thermoplasmatota archaeon]